MNSGIAQVCYSHDIPPPPDLGVLGSGGVGRCRIIALASDSRAMVMTCKDRFYLLNWILIIYHTYIQ